LRHTKTPLTVATARGFEVDFKELESEDLFFYHPQQPWFESTIRKQVYCHNQFYQDRLDSFQALDNPSSILFCSLHCYKKDKGFDVFPWKPPFRLKINTSTLQINC
jgi:hypothetical protein